MNVATGGPPTPDQLVLKKILYKSSIKGSHRNKLQFSQAEQIAMLHQMTGGQLYQGGPSTDIFIRSDFKNGQVKGRAYFQLNGRVIVDICELMKGVTVGEGDILIFKSTNQASVLDVSIITATCEVCKIKNDNILVQCNSVNCAKSFHPECYPNNQVYPTKCPYCQGGKLVVLDRSGILSNGTTISVQTLYENLSESGALLQQNQTVPQKRQLENHRQQLCQNEYIQRSVQSGQYSKRTKLNNFAAKKQATKIITYDSLLMEEGWNGQQQKCIPRLPFRIKGSGYTKEELEKQARVLSEQIKISTNALKETHSALDSILAALEASQNLLTLVCSDNYNYQ
eukprot:TRINITY_DN35535_c0_g1_i3.p1 TRINITY_DN35535_c0_g1~~TRINITY_DN35535_c0_g1_i3.p1  ORF type:complete len:368 (-),score=30.92 TRINITY_DN35535_c0_g1_i3:259-1278(-)